MAKPKGDVAQLPIAYYILLAEFDIDTGSCLRACYPPTAAVVEEAKTSVDGITLSGAETAPKESCAINFDESYCASHMLPDGAEKQTISRTIFIVNRSEQLTTHRFPVFTFCMSGVVKHNEFEELPLNLKEKIDWVRKAASEKYYIDEELTWDEATCDLCIYSKGNTQLGPISITTPNEFKTLLSLPECVITFLKELERDTNMKRIKTSTDGENSHFFSEMITQQTRDLSHYSFLVLQVNSIYYGFLMLSVHCARLIKSMDIFFSRKRTKHTTEGIHSCNQLPPLYGLSAVVTRNDNSARRGGISKSVALLGPTLVRLEPFFPLLVETVLKCCDIKGKTEEALMRQTKLLERCFMVFEEATVSLRRHLRELDNLLELEVMRMSSTNSNLSHILYTAAPFGTPHYIEIPLLPELYDFTFSRYGLEQLVEACGASFWILLTAILLEKRVVILSRQGFSNDVCEAALSLGLIGNLLDEEFTTKKIFPYTSVNGYSHFCNVPGYIVGTLNPIFETQHAWWDVLCDLDNKSVVLSPETLENRIYTELVHDVQFIQNLISRIYRMRAMLKPLHERQRAVLFFIEEYLGLMLILNESSYDCNHSVMQSIQNTFLTSTLAHIRAHALCGVMLKGGLRRILFPGNDPSLLISVATLRRASDCDTVELLQALCFLLNFVKSGYEVLLFLRRMPLALDGLNSLAAQLLHSSSEVRQMTLELLRRVEAFPAGRAAIGAMNGFLSLVYEEVSQGQTECSAKEHFV